MRIDPVKGHIRAAVLDKPAQWQAGLQGAPHLLERFRWHVRVAHDIMATANQLFAAKTAGVDERVVHVRDQTDGPLAGELSADDFKVLSLQNGL